jgi:hypothetical protein
MPLQIRRGPTADRLATTPLVGEIVYDTTLGSVYVGNGTTPGGLPVTNFSVADARETSAKLFLGESLGDNSVHSGVTFAYVGNRLQATVQQDLSNYIGLIVADQGFKGNVWADDSGLIVNSENHTVYGNFVPQGHIIPETNIAYDLGTSEYRFRDLYLSGSSLYLGDAVITSTGTAVDLPIGSTIGGQPVGINEGDTYDITISGNVIAADSTVLVNTITGQFNGDLYGSVFGFDSSVLVDARDGVLRGTLIGSLFGNVTGDVNGNANTATVASTVTLTTTNTSSSVHYLTFVDTVTGNEQIRTDTGLTYLPSTNTLSASTFSATEFSGSLVGNVLGNVTGNVTGSLTGNLVGSSVGYHTGDVLGSVFGADSAILVDAVDGVLRGTLVGNADTATVAATATVATSVTLITTDSSASTHYLAFTANSSGDESVRSDTSLTYQPSTNTLATGIVNATTINVTSVSATSLTGNIFTSLIDTADSGAITVTPAVVFSSDVTVENELFIGGDVFPDTSESYNLGSYTKKFSKLYLTEGENALWIGNAAISGSGTTVNLPAGSTVGGSAITTAAGSNATTITVNTTGTNAGHFISFFDDQTGDNLIYTDDTFRYNPGTGILTVGDAVIGSVTGNLIGNVTGSLFGNADTATAASTVTLIATNTTAASHFVTFVDSATGNENLRTDTSLTYNPNTDTLTAGTFAGSVTVTEGQIRTVSTSTGNIPFKTENYTNVASSTVNWRWERSRGTEASPLRVQASDHIGRIEFTAFNGTSIDSVAQIRVEAASSTVSGQATGLIRFLTTDTDGTTGTAMVISANKNITMATGNLTVTQGTITSGAGFNTGFLNIFDNKISTTTTNADIELDPNGSGTVDFRVSQQTTVGAAGVASPLPATPSLYFTIRVNGASYVVPAYAVS